MAERIQTIEPHYNGDREAVVAYWERVKDDPLSVVIVEGLSGTAGAFETQINELAVFSSYGLAMKHAKALPCFGAVIFAKRIDEPLLGNSQAH